MHSSILVTRLDGSTLCVPAPAGGMPVVQLMDAICAADGIPPEAQRLVRGGRELCAASAMVAGPLPPVTLLLRMAGGKGGFGALLRFDLKTRPLQLPPHAHLGKTQVHKRPSKTLPTLT